MSSCRSGESLRPLDVEAGLTSMSGLFRYGKARSRRRMTAQRVSL